MLFDNKKRMISAALVVFLLTGTSAPAMAAQDVTVTLPAFPVTLNDNEMEPKYEEYPVIVYNNITYFPMTFNYAHFLGLATSGGRDDAGKWLLGIWNATEYNYKMDTLERYRRSIANNDKLTASIAPIEVTVNGKIIDNSKEEYPLLFFRDIVYFPLTWRFAVDEFGWDYSFDAQNGLNIVSEVTPITPAQTEAKTVYVTGDVVNLRKGAGINYERGGQVLEGDVLTVVGSSKDKDGELWYQVQLEDGVLLWIASWLVSDKKTSVEADVSTGVLTAAELQPAQQDARKTSFSVKHGEDNIYSIQKVSDTLLQLELDNVIVNESLSAYGEGFNLDVVSAGNHKAMVTLRYEKGSYAAVEQNGDWLTLNCYTTSNGLAGKTIVLDPGHGGADSGAQGRTMPHVTDADVGYTVACKLKTLLEQQGAAVVLTRGDLNKNERVFVTERMELSNGIEPDIFVSIHADSTEQITKATGAGVYTYNGKAYTQQYLSEQLAENICDGLKISTERKAAAKKANYYVLRLNNHPSVLVECGYLSNPDDEALLATDAYRDKLAEGIYRGIESYFNF